MTENTPIILEEYLVSEELRLQVKDWIINFHPQPESDIVKNGQLNILENLKNREISSEEISTAVEYLKKVGHDVFKRNIETGLPCAVAAYLISEAIRNSNQ